MFGFACNSWGHVHALLSGRVSSGSRCRQSGLNGDMKSHDPVPSSPNLLLFGFEDGIEASGVRGIRVDRSVTELSRIGGQWLTAYFAGGVHAESHGAGLPGVTSRTLPARGPRRWRGRSSSGHMRPVSAGRPLPPGPLPLSSRPRPADSHSLAPPARTPPDHRAPAAPHQMARLPGPLQMDWQEAIPLRVGASQGLSAAAAPARAPPRTRTPSTPRSCSGTVVNRSAGGLHAQRLMRTDGVALLHPRVQGRLRCLDTLERTAVSASGENWPLNGGSKGTHLAIF